MNKQTVLSLMLLLGLTSALDYKLLKEVAGFEKSQNLDAKSPNALLKDSEDFTDLQFENDQYHLEASPKVEHMGLYYTNMLGNTSFGIDFAHMLDIGLIYRTPYYSEKQYLALGLDISLHAASFSHLKFLTPMGNMRFNLELNGMKVVPRGRAYYDIETYADVCYAADVYTRGVELLITAEVDLYDCNIGAVSTFWGLLFNWLLKWTYSIGDAGVQCELKNYSFDQRPLWRLGFDDYNWWKTQLIPQTCVVR